MWLRSSQGTRTYRPTDEEDPWRYEVRNAVWQTSNPKDQSFTGNYGNTVRVWQSMSEYESDQRYISRYTVDAMLQNGGQGWRKGDQVNVYMGGKNYNVRVTAERYTYAYASAGQHRSQHPQIPSQVSWI